MTEHAQAWICQTLIGAHGHFESSMFPFSLTLYRTPLTGSFVLALIDGNAQPAQFRVPEGQSRYCDLLGAVHEAAAGETAFWFYVSDPDGALSVLDWIRPSRPFYAHDYHNLEAFEQLPAAEGGNSRLGLAGTSQTWLLLHEYSPGESFEISVHGSERFCRGIAAAVGVAAEPLVAPDPRRLHDIDE